MAQRCTPRHDYRVRFGWGRAPVCRRRGSSGRPRRGSSRRGCGPIRHRHARRTAPTSAPGRAGRLSGRVVLRACGRAFCWRSVVDLRHAPLARPSRADSARRADPPSRRRRRMGVYRGYGDRVGGVEARRGLSSVRSLAGGRPRCPWPRAICGSALHARLFDSAAAELLRSDRSPLIYSERQT
jgi:hypothetical protein